ncbi:pimeloyl-ACP methyl ester esterase BioH, partial [Thiococcus pfennigii]|uniref:pimeloyl-ACP methyl ester esterase BioH n=1 Tax=Thiococcus pfennigii TaxID=1057 RepID=UPI0019087783
NTGVWEGLPAGFAARVREHRIALPGHGGSPLGADPATLAEWADACLAAAPERAVWAGWSLGGLLALAAALRAPERVAGLILITATPRFVRGPDWPQAMPLGTLDQFQANLLADPPGTLERFLALQVRGSDGAVTTLRRLRAAIHRHPPPLPEALAAGLRLLRESDLRDELAQLACPSLWLFGARDTLVPAALGEAIRARLPTAQVQAIDGAGHAPFLSHAAPSAAAMGAFLTQVLTEVTA